MFIFMSYNRRTTQLLTQRYPTKPNDNPASQTPTSAIFTIAAFNQEMLNDESCGLYHKIDLKCLPSQNHHILNNTNGIQQHYRKT